MTHDELVDLLIQDISEHKFEIRAKTRSLRGDLDALITALDADQRPIFSFFAARAAEIEREFWQMQTKAEILKRLEGNTDAR